VPISHKRDLIPLDHFHRNICKAVCLHLRLYCGVDVTMVAIEVNKFTIQGYRLISILLISPPKVIYLRRIILCRGYSTFFFQTYIFRITLYISTFQEVFTRKNPKRLNTSIQGVTKFANSEFRAL
jgi:hypothetical protein